MFYFSYLGVLFLWYLFATSFALKCLSDYPACPYVADKHFFVFLVLYIYSWVHMRRTKQLSTYLCVYMFLYYVLYMRFFRNLNTKHVFVLTDSENSICLIFNDVNEIA